MKNIAVFFGGTSVERDVSVITGVLTCNSLDKNKFRVYPVYIDGDGTWWTGEKLRDPDFCSAPDFSVLKRVCFIAGSPVLYAVGKVMRKRLCEISVAVNCLHGERGEDGSLYAVATQSKIAVVGSDIIASAVAMDKLLTKKAVKGMANVLPFTVAESSSDERIKELPFSYPVIVKPVRGGSSIGVKTAENAEELKRAVDYALKFGRKALIEPCLSDFKEINCAAYQGKTVTVSECESPVRRTDFLTFSDKYESGKREFPADIPPSVSSAVKRTTEKVYKTLGFGGVIRIDYFLVGKKIYLNEINAVPGSMAYYLFSESLSGFGKMLTEMIETASSRFAEESTFKRTYDSGILRGVGSKGAKRL